MNDPSNSNSTKARSKRATIKLPLDTSSPNPTKPTLLEIENPPIPTILQETEARLIQRWVDTLKSFSEDKKKVRELLTHCIYSIYRK